jgi:RNA-directed DNA polymerase
VASGYLHRQDFHLLERLLASLHKGNGINLKPFVRTQWVVSPVLANIYLHEVLDKWFAQQVVPRLAGRATLVRYADELVIIFEYERDARRVFDVLPKRLAKYGLTFHPEKTRLIDFWRSDRRTPASHDSNGDARSRPDTFDLLGFTHYWAMSRKGFWVVKQKTAADRFRRALKRIADWCRRYRHEPVREQWAALEQSCGQFRS